MRRLAAAAVVAAWILPASGCDFSFFVSVSNDDDPSLLFFQLRIRASGGLAQIVDGAGNRAGGVPPDRSLRPVLSVTFRP